MAGLSPAPAPSATNAPKRAIPLQPRSPQTHPPGGAAVPEAISFRQLETLRLCAIEAGRTGSGSGSAPDSPFTSPIEGPSPGDPLPGQPQNGGDELAELEQLLGAYGQLGQRLLQQLARQGTALEQHRHPQQVMALGALAAHIRLGLQALAASRQ